MTFFFQTNPIGVILKIVLAIPSFIIAVGGCFSLTVQNTLNKVRASIIKCASHGSRALMKVSCSDSMCFCKKKYPYFKRNKHFLSLLLTVLHGSYSGGWRRTYASRAPLRYASLTSLFTGAKEAKFSYFSKGTPVSSWLISKSSDIFLYKSSVCTSNSWLVFCFVLSPRSSLITHHRCPLSSAETVSAYGGSDRKVFITFEIWIFFLQKRMDSLQEAFIHPPEPCEQWCSLRDTQVYGVYPLAKVKDFHLPT